MLINIYILDNLYYNLSNIMPGINYSLLFNAAKELN